VFVEPPPHFARNDCDLTPVIRLRITQSFIATSAHAPVSLRPEVREAEVMDPQFGAGAVLHEDEGAQIVAS